MELVTDRSICPSLTDVSVHPTSRVPWAPRLRPLWSELRTPLSVAPTLPSPSIGLWLDSNR